MTERATIVFNGLDIKMPDEDDVTTANLAFEAAVKAVLLGVKKALNVYACVGVHAVKNNDRQVATRVALLGKTGKELFDAAADAMLVLKALQIANFAEEEDGEQ